MTVEQLIELLKKLDPRATVFIDFDCEMVPLPREGVFAVDPERVGLDHDGPTVFIKG